MQNEILIRHESWSASDLITFVSVLGSLIVSIGSLVINVILIKINKKNTLTANYVNTITKNRVEWLENLKSLFSTFESSLHLIQTIYKKGEKVTEVVENISNVMHKIIHELSIKGIIEINIIIIMKSTTREVAKSLGDNDISQMANSLRKLFSIYTRIYTKTEWKRIDFECKNSLAKTFDFESCFLDLLNTPEIKKEYDDLIKDTKINLK